jgi:hypothetical protein
MMPRITPRLDRQRALGFGRRTAGSGTPVGALAGEVCPAWSTATAMPSAPVERDRVDAREFATTTNRSIAKGANYAPSQQPQLKNGAGGVDRCT